MVRRPGSSRTSVAPTNSARFNRSAMGWLMHCSLRSRTIREYGKKRVHRLRVYVNVSRGSAGPHPRLRLRVYVNDGAAVFVYDAVPVFGDGGVGPLEQPGRVFRGQVDAAVASHLTEVVVPVRAVKRVALMKV